MNVKCLTCAHEFSADAQNNMAKCPRCGSSTPVPMPDDLMECASCHKRIQKAEKESHYCYHRVQRSTPIPVSDSLPLPISDSLPVAVSDSPPVNGARVFGALLVCGAMIMLAFFLFFFDVSADRTVVNLGLMNDRLVFVIVGVGILIGGVLVIGLSNREKINTVSNS